MFVYVIDRNKNPLMPTQRFGKVRRMLRDKKAKVVRRTPFTIQLLYDTVGITQDVTLGVDSGSKMIGLSATTNKKVLFEAEVELRTDIVKKIATRREARRARRNRKTRYRKPRFNNRVRREKWLAPSVQHKVDTHLQMIALVHKLLPISKIIVEVAAFDIQKIKNPNIQGVEYQQGEQMGFWNVREYVLFRDGHICQCCKVKSKDKILDVHHIESRKTGGDAPNNLITLCETCHQGYHKGIVKLPKTIRRGMSFRDATFMGIMRWAFYDKLKELYNDVYLTYGYITKHVRIKNKLSKEHIVDARCISGNANAIVDDNVFYFKKVRRHNRQIHKANILKGGVKRLNQAPHFVKGYCLFDKVKYQNREYFIFGRRERGSFDIRNLSGEKVNKGGISYKKLTFVERANGYVVERRCYFPLMTEVTSVQIA